MLMIRDREMGRQCRQRIEMGPQIIDPGDAGLMAALFAPQLRSRCTPLLTIDST